MQGAIDQRCCVRLEPGGIVQDRELSTLCKQQLRRRRLLQYGLHGRVRLLFGNAVDGGRRGLLAHDGGH